MKTWRICAAVSACVLCFVPCAMAIAARAAKKGTREVVAAAAAEREAGVWWSREGSEVEVRFDRPVVDPHRIGEAAPLRANVAGVARWTGVASAAFTPDAPWPPSFDVRLDVDVPAAPDGARATAASWGFRTPGLAAKADVASVYGPNPVIPVRFDAAVDPAEAARFATFVRDDSHVPAKGTAEGLVPEKGLVTGNWTLRIRSGLVAAGGARLEQDWSADFRVAGTPELREARGRSSLSLDNELVLEFSEALSAPTLEKRITVMPAVAFRWLVSGRDLRLLGPFRPGETYWVRIADGAEDRFGGRPGAVAAVVTVPRYPVTLALDQAAGWVERFDDPAVPLVAASVPEARVRIFRLPGEPWSTSPGELTEVREFPANDRPNDIFTHAVRFPGPGAWRVEVEAPELKMGSARTYQITDLAPIVKIGAARSFVAVTTLQGALPVAGADVAIHGGSGALLWSGRTGAEGWVEAPGAGDLGRPQFATVRTAGDACWIDLGAREIAGWRLGVRTAEPESAAELPLFLQTDRPVYRPGETVSVKGWRRGGGAPAATFVLRGWDGDRIGEATREFSAAGGVDAAFALPPNARPGRYEVTAQSDGRQARVSVEVGEYRPAAMDVTVKPRVAKAFPGDRVEADVRARTFFGAPLAGARVEWRAWVDDEGTLAGGAGRLDGEGTFVVSVPAGKNAGRLTIEAEVLDAGNQAASASADIAVREADVDLGVTLDRGLVCAGQKLGVAIAATAPGGGTFHGVLEARLVRRTWSSVQRAVAGGGWQFVDQAVDEVVESVSPAPALWEVTPGKSGHHFVEVVARDAAGRSTRCVRGFDVEGAGAAWEPRDNLLLTLTPDRERYRPGEVARVLVRGALPGSTALVTLERDGVSAPRWIGMEDGSATVEVAITEAMAPNVHLSVMAIRGRATRALGRHGEDPGRPAMRVGAALLAVDAGFLRIPVAVRVPPHALPGESLTVDIETAPGAEIALAVVDAAVLALAGEGDPDPLEFFQAEQPLRVRTSEIRGDVAGLRPMDFRGKKGRPGGGGGGPATRCDFRGTAFWAPALTAGPDGRARATFRLPDNTTRWRAVAVASTGTRWGTGAAEFAVDRPLTLVPALPRVLRSGDRFLARVVVHNRGAADGVARVSFGGRAADGLVKAGDSRPFDFEDAAGQPGERRFRFDAELDGNRDSVELTVPVRFPTATESEVVSGAASGRLRLEGTGFVSIEEATLSIGATPLAEIDGELRRLLDYPHG